MRRSRHRVAIILALVASGAFLMAGPGTGCLSFTGESLLTNADFCFILDCQNGFLGGTIQPCSGLMDNSGEQPSLTDCPGFFGP